MGFNMAEAVSGDYISKNDVPTTGTNIQIAGVSQEKIGQEQEQKFVLWFLGDELKPLVLNKTNINILRALYGDDSDSWKGKHVNVYNDPTVGYAGQITGGVRLRMPTPGSDAPIYPQTSVPSNAAPAAPQNDFDDDIPDFGQGTGPKA